jgi:hypothetical protein
VGNSQHYHDPPPARKCISWPGHGQICAPQGSAVTLLLFQKVAGPWCCGGGGTGFAPSSMVLMVFPVAMLLPMPEAGPCVLTLLKPPA